MAREKAPMPSAAPASDKKRAIDTAMAQIEKMYGKGSIMRFGDNVELNVDYVPTGSLALDVALGIGGLPRGRIIEIYGPESSGKTTLALHILAQAQKQGGEVAFVAVLSAVVAAVVGWGYVPCRYLAVFRLLEGALCHYTRSIPPSVRKYFPTQMRCASLAARSTFGCFSGFKYGRRAERNCIVWLLLS